MFKAQSLASGTVGSGWALKTQELVRHLQSWGVRVYSKMTVETQSLLSFWPQAGWFSSVTHSLHDALSHHSAKQ